MSNLSDPIETAFRKMSFNFNLPLGPWFVIVVIIVALFMALICTAIMYICCRGCYTAGTLPGNGAPASGISPQTLNALTQDKPPSYRRFLRNLSNINLRMLGNSNANTNRIADTGTPPPKYGDVVSKFQFTSKEIKEFESMQNNFTANYKFRPSISEALRQPPENARQRIIIPQVCVTPPPTENSETAASPEQRVNISDPPPKYTPPSGGTFANHAPEGGYDNPTCVISDVT